MKPLENKFLGRLRRWVALEDSKGFLGPEQLAGRNPPTEAPGMTKPLRFSQIGLPTPELLSQLLHLGNQTSADGGGRKERDESRDI